MDVRNLTCTTRLVWAAFSLNLLIVAPAMADPMYTAIDLGTGSLAYGVNSSGNGIVTGSNGLTYTFNPVQNDLPAQWSNTTQGVPIVEPAPVTEPGTNGNPNYAYSYSTMSSMNDQGLAAGVNMYGVAGHLETTEDFVTQLQPNGTWGPGIPLWSGSSPSKVIIAHGILGISSNGQVLGYGVPNPTGPPIGTLYLYDSKTQTITNMTSLINSMTWTTSTQLPPYQISNWVLSSDLGQFDDQGRILVQATEGAAQPGAQPAPDSGRPLDRSARGSRALDLGHLRHPYRRLDGPERLRS